MAHVRRPRSAADPLGRGRPLTAPVAAGALVRTLAERIGPDLRDLWTDEDTVEFTIDGSRNVEVLTRAWDPLKRRLRALNARWDKPVLITDLGYESKADQAAAAAYEAEGEPSEEAQAALYEAAFRAFQGNAWFAGKQAEEVLRAWHTAGR